MRWTFAPALVLSALAVPAHAVQYLTIERAQAVLFPAGAQFVAQDVLLTDDQRSAVSKASGVRVRDAHVRLWAVTDAKGVSIGRVFVDEVTGKNDVITYALAVTPDGKVAGIEILDYRESHGGEIRDASWRSQFSGKTIADPLKIDRDVQNISGATLSCWHVTDGVRRLLVVNSLIP